MLKPKMPPADTMADLIPVSDVLRSPTGDYTLLTDGTTPCICGCSRKT